MSEHVAAQVAHGQLAGLRHDERLPELERRAQEHGHEVEDAEPEERRNRGRALEDPVEPGGSVSHRRARLSAEGAGHADARRDDLVDAGLHDPRRRELQQEHGKDEQEREHDLAAVRRHVLPQTPEQPGVVGLPESLLLVQRVLEGDGGARAVERFGTRRLFRFRAVGRCAHATASSLSSSSSSACWLARRA